MSHSTADLALFEVGLDAGHLEAYRARRPNHRHNPDLRSTQSELAAVAQFDEAVGQAGQFMQTVRSKPLKTFFECRNGTLLRVSPTILLQEGRQLKSEYRKRVSLLYSQRKLLQSATTLYYIDALRRPEGNARRLRAGLLEAYR